MRRILILALHDLRLTVKDRPVLFWMVLTLVAFIYVFSFMGGGDSSPQIGLAVLDEDRSFLARSFTEALTREGFRVRDLQTVSEDSLAGWPRSVRIPQGFQDSIVTARPVPVYFRAHPPMLTLPAR